MKKVLIEEEVKTYKQCKHKWKLFEFNGNRVSQIATTTKAVCEKCLEVRYL